MVEVSVIIINYNTTVLTNKCIASIIRFSENVDYEIIIIDNNSKPKFTLDDECSNAEIKVLYSDKNIGFARANNLGLYHATGKHILLLNSDTELLNNAIGNSLKKIKTQSSIGVISAQLVSPNGELQHPAERFPSLKRELRELFRLNKSLISKERAEYYLGSAFDHQSEVECDWVWGTFFMFSRKLVACFAERRLPDDFFMYGEDMQWCWAIKKLGYKIIYYPEAKILHHGAGSAELSTDRKHYITKILPNTYRVVVMEKGPLYAWILYFVKALHLLTLRKAHNIGDAVGLFRFLLGKKKYSMNN
ncbi:MAG: glycosyltransferase family 2 protein [Cyclobacteriaceae bacterium]